MGGVDIYMRYEAKKTLLPTPYNPNKFRDKDTLLIEIVINFNNKAKMYLYYEDATLSLRVDEKNRLYYIDRKAQIGFKEGKNCEAINVYDSYSIESLKFNYNDERYNAIEYLMIYANGLTKPALKFHYKITENNPMDYKCHAIVRNQ